MAKLSYIKKKKNSGPPTQYLPTDFAFHSFIAYSPTNETYELPQFPVDVKTKSENVITSSNPAYGHFQTSKQKNDTKEDKEEKALDHAYEIPHLSARDDTTVKANPARSENVITSSNVAYGHFQISRQEHDTKEDEGEDHTYEILPFDTPRQ